MWRKALYIISLDHAIFQIYKDVLENCARSSHHLLVHLPDPLGAPAIASALCHRRAREGRRCSLPRTSWRRARWAARSGRRMPAAAVGPRRRGAACREAACKDQQLRGVVESVFGFLANLITYCEMPYVRSQKAPSWMKATLRKYDCPSMVPESK